MKDDSLGCSRKQKNREWRHSPEPRPAKLSAQGKGKKGYEIEGKNRGVCSGGVHLALAYWSADSGADFVFSASWLHLEVRDGQGSTWGKLAEGVRVSGDRLRHVAEVLARCSPP